MTEYEFMGTVYRVGDEITFSYKNPGGSRYRGVINEIGSDYAGVCFLFLEIEVTPSGGGDIYTLRDGGIRPEMRDWVITNNTECVELI